MSGRSDLGPAPWLRLLFPLVLLFACSRADDAQAGAATSRAVEPDIAVVGFDGLKEALARRAGQPLLVNFWAIWCGPCVAELPDLVATATEFRERGGEVIGVSMDATAPGFDLEGVRRRMPAFLRKKGIGFPILIYDGEPWPVVEHFDLPSGIPVTLAIDADGATVAKHLGQASRDEFAELVAAALAAR